MRRAAKTDANHSAIVSALRSCGAFVQSLASIGKGCPDLLVASRRAGLILLEVKDGAKPKSARVLTSHEKLWHEQIKKLSGITVYVVNNVEEAIEAATMDR